MEFAQRGVGTEGTVVITDNQYGGRGQRGNLWVSEPGKNFTFSVLLKPALRADRQFLLTQVVALAVADYVRSKAGHVKIKWPNDILVNDKKLCGVLIENSLVGSAIQVVIAGVGLNVNQAVFKDPKATSLKLITGKEYDLNQELELLLHCIEVRYLQLREGKVDQLNADYRNNLYRLGERHLFETAGEKFQGLITGVDETGRLLVETGQGARAFGLKEIRFADA
ncbi:MAG: biotin--[acetyl-CoA-carboxylase] ligase [Cyclobacteriaceae bacterium]|nr:biotin--[acetyl-CoA-carboxylase] ligase [Cyclobacteriaceae bacterium]